MKINSAYIPPSGLVQPAREAKKSGTQDSFAGLLSDALQEVNRLQVNAVEATAAMAAGKAEDIHQVMLANEQARLSLQLAVQVRNKLVEAYQEISRMQF